MKQVAINITYLKLRNYQMKKTPYSNNVINYYEIFILYIIKYDNIAKGRKKQVTKLAKFL